MGDRLERLEVKNFRGCRRVRTPKILGKAVESFLDRFAPTENRENFCEFLGI